MGGDHWGVIVIGEVGEGARPLPHHGPPPLQPATHLLPELRLLLQLMDPRRHAVLRASTVVNPLH